MRQNRFGCSPLKGPLLTLSTAPLLDIAIALPGHGSRKRTRSLYLQLKEAIINGRLQPGLSLPATRTLAAELGVARNTVVSAYQALLSDGYLSSRHGSGTYVAPVARLTASRRVGAGALARHHASSKIWRIAAATLSQSFANAPQHSQYNFQVGIPDKRHFPFDKWRQLSTRTLRAFAREPVSRVDPQGRLALREAISRHVSYARALACDSDNIIVTTGAQQAFDLLARSLVTSGRTIVALEEPGYPMLRAAFLAAGAKIVPVRVDEEGLMVDRLPEETKIVCVTPSHQYPLGVVMSLRRRVQLLEFARARRAVIVEDDYDGEFRVGGHPVDNLKTLDAGEHVFFVGTFSKCIFPSIRLGFVLAPRWAVPQLIAAKRISDFYTSVDAQDTLALFISEGHLAKHVRKMRRIYDERRLALYSAIRTHFNEQLDPIVVSGGLHLTAWASSPEIETGLIQKAARHQIRLQPLSGYYAGRTAKPGIIFGVGGIDKTTITEGIFLMSRPVGAERH